MFALAALILGALLLLRTGVPGSLKSLADPPVLVRQIQRLEELATVRYSVQKVVAFEEQKQPVGAERILLIVQAQVRAGVDLSSMNVGNLKILGERHVYVAMPEPKLLGVTIDEKETRVWDRSVTWWTPWVPFNPDLERQARMAAIRSIEQTALEMGILEQAKRNARETIRGLLSQAGIERVDFDGPLSLHRPEKRAQDAREF